MTLYNGESLQVTSTATGTDDVALTDSDVDEVVIRIWAPGTTAADDPIVSDIMSWSAGDSWWFFNWDTVGLEPGTYLAQVKVNGPGSTVSWEYKRIRLIRDKRLEV